MLCKNCNYILTGKENFCPNCASPLSEKVMQPAKTKEEDREKERQRDKPDEQILSREFIFPEKEEKSFELRRDSRIFFDDTDNSHEKNRDKKKSYAGRILLLLFMTCVFAAGCFAVADYFNFTPSVFGFLNGQATDSDTTSASDLFSHESSIVKPDITYAPERAYIMSGEGLNLRKGPGKNFAPVANLSDLTAVVIYGGSLAAEGWVYAYCDEKKCYGWLDASFLARELETTTLEAENTIGDESEVLQ